MSQQAIETAYRMGLNSFRENGVLSPEQARHFLERGIDVISPSEYGLDTIAKYFGDIVIGASPEYRRKMKSAPYQATSYVAADSGAQDNKTYVFKVPGMKGGGVEMLFGGKRRIGDEANAAIHRSVVGYKAIMISGENLMQNADQVWNRKWFMNRVRDLDENLYRDIKSLPEKMNIPENPYNIVILRSKSSFKRLGLVEAYAKGKVTILNPANNIRSIIVTSDEGYEYAKDKIPESELIRYVNTGAGEFNIVNGMRQLRKDFDLDIMLNDGGRQMSNAVRDAGLLGEERVTLEPYPGKGFLPENLPESDPTSVLGRKGDGIDGGELKGSIKIYSRNINGELANIYLYPLDEKKIF